MTVSDTLPPKPLDRADRRRMRARSDVKAVTVLGTASIHDRWRDRTASAEHLVVLVDRTVCALEYDGSGWSEEVLDTDATKRDQLEYALDLMNDVRT